VSFKIFPAWITPEGRKVPLLKGWQDAATTDPEQIKLWQDLYRDRLKIWGIPCGPINGILVLDADAKSGGLETLKTLQLPATLMQQTRSGGFHFFFKYPTDGHRYGQRVGFKPGLDIRGAGGWAAYYGFTDPTHPIADAPQWLLDEALKIDIPEVAPGAAIQVAPEIAQGIIAKALEAIREAPAGEANNTLNTEAFRLGQLVAASAISREYAETALFRAAKDRGKPDYEARATIESGLNGGLKHPLTSPFGAEAPVVHVQIPEPPGPPARWTPNYFTTKDILDVSKLRKPQLFQDWSTEDIAITTADGGTGKTTLKLYEAICLALGERFLGFNPVQQGKTLYITGEDTQAKLGSMIGVILRQMGLLENFPGFAEKVQTVLSSVVVKKDADLCLIMKDRQGFITPHAEAMRKVMEAVDDLKPKLIIFDPISSFWGSESALNDMNKAVTKFMSELVERSGACVEMINHMGKSSSQAKDMTQFAGRGGTGLPSNSRVSRVLRPVFEDEYLELTGEHLADKQSAMMCVINKFSDGSPLYNKPFLILRDGYLFSRKTLTPQKEKEQREHMTDMERVFTFIKEMRAQNKYPTQPVVIASFANNGNPMSRDRTVGALKMLQFQGHMGEMIKAVENPDPTVKDRVYVIADMEGREI
jgi:RecA-family ATPase